MIPLIDSDRLAFTGFDIIVDNVATYTMHANGLDFTMEVKVMLRVRAKRRSNRKVN